MYKLKAFFAVIFLTILVGTVSIYDSNAELGNFDVKFNAEISETIAKNVQIKKLDLKTMKASWYGPKFHGKLTANGEIYDQMALTVAHKTLPFGTLLLLTNESNGKEVIVRVNDRGPYIGNRELDLSKGAAIALGTLKVGVKKLKVQQLVPEKHIHSVL